MKKLGEVILAPNDFGVLFSLERMRVSVEGMNHIIERDCYSELMRGRENEGVLVYIPKKEYEELKKQGKVD